MSRVQTSRFNSGSKYLILSERVLPNYERKQRDLKLEVTGCDRLGMKRGKVCRSKSVGGSECVYTGNNVDRTGSGKSRGAQNFIGESSSFLVSLLV